MHGRLRSDVGPCIAPATRSWESAVRQTDGSTAAHSRARATRGMCGVGAWGLGGIDTPRSGGFEIIGHPDHTQPAPREIYRQGEERDLARRPRPRARKRARSLGAKQIRRHSDP